MRGKQYSFNDQVIVNVDDYFADLPENYYTGRFINFKNVEINI